MGQNVTYVEAEHTFSSKILSEFVIALLRASLDMLLVMHEKLMTARQQSSGLDRCRQPTKKSSVRDNFLP